MEGRRVTKNEIPKKDTKNSIFANNFTSQLYHQEENKNIKHIVPLYNYQIKEEIFLYSPFLEINQVNKAEFQKICSKLKSDTQTIKELKNRISFKAFPTFLQKFGFFSILFSFLLFAFLLTSNSIYADWLFIVCFLISFCFIVLMSVYIAWNFYGLYYIRDDLNKNLNMLDNYLLFLNYTYFYQNLNFCIDSSLKELIITKEENKHSYNFIY